MSRFRESRRFSNEGSTLVEVLRRYLERRRRDRQAKRKGIAAHDPRRKVSGTSRE